ncbi:hypothetical protein MtrunA17_Chr2g0325881 [Medicago truncatula]|uniref:Transmembrane protein, putative n=1 Tax=Medicago truncatula TaxID=3880 RepID=G7IU35_MEDTR|nr:transmembrane protein, putative [Medicago truncatula]RHN75869.1 hypothetical protein MtrunA17_Chr2g0325881 [Medicago truncatula]
MAREFHAILGGGQGDYNSGILYLLGIIFLSLSVLSIIIFSCGDDNHHKHRKRRGGRGGISGIGGDGGGHGGGGGVDGGGGGGGG